MIVMKTSGANFKTICSTLNGNDNSLKDHLLYKTVGVT